MTYTRAAVATYFAALLAGLTIIAVGGVWGLRGADVAYAEQSRPEEPPTDALIQASVRGCLEGLGAASVTVNDGVATIKCKPSLGVLPTKRKP